MALHYEPKDHQPRTGPLLCITRTRWSDAPQPSRSTLISTTKDEYGNTKDDSTCIGIHGPA